jgi:hypothetical protein
MTPWGSDIYNNFFRILIFKFIFRNHYFTTDSFEIKKILNNFSTRNKIYKINFGININFYNQKFKNKSLTNKKIILCPRGYDEIYNNDLILTESLIEEGITQLKDIYSTLNKGINKIELLINKISDIKEEYNIHSDLILNLINDQINDF